MFTLGTNDLQYLFEQAGESILINDAQQQAIITNPAISEYEERYIHTLDKVSRGDLVTMEGEQYLVITETVTKRHSKYKTLARHCNGVAEKRIYNQVYIGDDSFGNPKYRDEYDHSEFAPAIVDNKSFTINNSTSWRYPENQIEVIVQDSETNRTLFAVNEKINTVNKWWKVINHDYSKVGMIIMTCENTTAPIV